MTVDIHITGDLSPDRTYQLQTALSNLALPGTDDKPPAFLGIDGIHASSVQTRLGDVALYVNIQLKETKP